MDNQKYDYSTLGITHSLEQRQPDRESQPGLEPAEWTYSQSTPQVRYDEPNYPEAIHPEENSREALAPHSLNHIQGEKRRIFGLKRRLFLFCLAAVIVIVIGAIVGGTCGALLPGKEAGSSKEDDDHSSPSSGTPKNSSISRISKLSSIDWKDADGVDFRALFYQNISGDLVFSLWDAQNNSWATTSISESMRDGPTTNYALNGTPLAAVVRGGPWAKQYNQPFRISLFFLSPDNVVKSLGTRDPRGQTWTFGVLTNHPGAKGNYQAGEGSQLAAWWALCEEECSGDIVLLFEDVNQNLQMANSSDWKIAPRTIQSTIIAGSGLAMDGLVPDYGLSNNWPSSPRAYYDTSNTLQETLWEYGKDEWSNSARLSQALPSEPPLLAAMAFENATDMAAGPLSLLVVSCFANGTLGANVFNNATWTPTLQPSLNGPEDANFTAITLDAAETLRFYGLTRNGSIWEYIVAREDPLSWSYVDTVPTR